MVTLALKTRAFIYILHVSIWVQLQMVLFRALVVAGGFLKLNARFENPTAQSRKLLKIKTFTYVSIMDVYSCAKNIRTTFKCNCNCLLLRRVIVILFALLAVNFSFKKFLQTKIL